MKVLYRFEKHGEPQTEQTRTIPGKFIVTTTKRQT